MRTNDSAGRGSTIIVRPLRLLVRAILASAGAALSAVIFTGSVKWFVERTAPPRGRFVDVDGNRVHVVERGSGPAIVMIHGMGGHLGNFAYALSERLAETHRVIMFDRPGSGHSTRAGSSSGTIGVQAAGLVRLIEILSLDRPLLVGHSYGAAIALAAALDWPERVGGLALVTPLTHPSPMGAPPGFRMIAVQSPLLRFLLSWTAAVPTILLRGRALTANAFGPEHPPADFGSRGDGLLALRPSSYVGSSVDFASANDGLTDMVGRYLDLRLPVGVLLAADDRILPNLQQGGPLGVVVPGAVVETVPGGHMLPVTQPDLVSGFIRRVGSRIVRT